MVDNTSGSGIGGGIYYNYRSPSRPARPPAAGTRRAWRCRFPFASRATIGGTVKYFSLSGDEAPAESHRRRHVRRRHDGHRPAQAVPGRRRHEPARSPQQPRGPGDRLRGRADPDAGPGDRRRRLDPVHARQPDRAQGDQRDGGRRPDSGGEVRRPRSGAATTPRPSTATDRAGSSLVSEVGAIDGGIRQDILVHEG